MCSCSVEQDADITRIYAVPLADDQRHSLKFSQFLYVRNSATSHYGATETVFVK